MARLMTSLAALAVVGACAAVPAGTQALTGAALQAELSGQRLELPPPDGSGIADGVLLLAELRTDGVAQLSATLDGDPIDLFDQTGRWQVRGQTLCIYDGAQPEANDCIRIDWIGGGRLQLNDTSTGDVGIGSYAPL